MNTIHKEFDEKIIVWIKNNNKTIEKLKDKTVVLFLKSNRNLNYWYE